MGAITQNINTFKDVIVTEIELKNGSKTQMITFFNHSEIGHDEVNVGIKTALEHSRKAKNMQSTVSSIRNAKLKPFCFFEKTIIQDYRPELDPALNPNLRGVF